MAFIASAVVAVFVLLQTAPSGTSPSPMAQSLQIDRAREVTLALPHALREGETAWLLVKVGVIGHNQIQLMMQDGRSLGTISAFGIRSGQSAGSYTVPVPASALTRGRLTLRLSVTASDGSLRAPTAEEIKWVRLLVRHFKGSN
jgi:hypothetical protein